MRLNRERFSPSLSFFTLSLHSGMPLMRWMNTSLLSTHTRCVLFSLYGRLECFITINYSKNFTLVPGKQLFFFLNIIQNN